MKYRIHAVIAFILAVVLAFTYVLYDKQIVHGAEYLAQSTRKIMEIQTVEAARGEILDRYGRVLVSNRLSYRVSLDISRMGNDEERQANLLRLIQICQVEGISWSDSLPINVQTPFVYTLDSSAANTRFIRFLTNRTATSDAIHEPARAALKNAEAAYAAEENTATMMELVAKELSAAAMMAYLREYYKIGESYSVNEARQIIGVLYELEIRRRNLTVLEYFFAEDVSYDFIARVKEESLPGVTIESTTSRVYHTEYAAHLLGRVGQIYEENWAYYQERGYSMNAIVGIDGVEATFEDYLRGTSGTRAVETNQAGKIVAEEYIVDPQPGDNVFLSIDINAQAAAEMALADNMPNFAEGLGAALVAIDVKDGGVIAMASYPTFNLETFNQDYNDLLEDPLKPMLNRATHGTYAPGSAYKMVSAVAALETGMITPTTLIRCTGRYTYYKDAASQPQCWIYRQYGGTHGAETVSDAITDSCNIFFYDVGRRLGIQTIGEYAAMFGLGQPTGIEIAELLGAVAGPAYSESVGQTWYEGNTMYAAVGQENNRFTPLQLANYCATIANGGVHNSVHLLQTVKSNDFRTVVYEREPEVQDTLAISETAMKAIHKGMLGVTTGSGSAARYFRDLDVQVAGKTGSAQIASDLEANAVFIAFAPYEEPEIALCVVVEQGGSGSEVGAIVADFMTYYFTVSQSSDTVSAENTLLR